MCMLDPVTSAMEGHTGDSNRQSPRINMIPDILLDLPSQAHREWPERRAACSCDSAECSADSGFSEPSDIDLCPHCRLDCGGGCQEAPSPNLLQVPISPLLNRSCSSEDASNCSACKKDCSENNQRSSSSDLEILSVTQGRLAHCDYYYGSISNTEAREKLRKTAHGTFLIRDSSHQKYLYAISTQTERGVTSVRVEYRNGTFRLDCERGAEKHMPTFDCVLKLIDYYISLSSDKVRNNCVWLESSGRRDTPVVLRTPLSKGVISRQTELPEDT